jgi:hypothetical protein
MCMQLAVLCPGAACSMQILLAVVKSRVLFYRLGTQPSPLLLATAVHLYCVVVSHLAFWQSLACAR